MAGCRIERAAGTPSAALGGLGNPPMQLTQDEIDAMAACLGPALDAVQALARDETIRATPGWRTMSTSYLASEHGMFLQVFANAAAAADYAKAEQGGRLPPGAAILKRSFRVDRAGNATAGSLYLMERMAPGYDSSTNDWRFTVTTPVGLRLGESGGEDAPAVAFCAGCHKSARVQDFLFFVPPRFRVAN
jgi:Cytochrome P460